MKNRKLIRWFLVLFIAVFFMYGGKVVKAADSNGVSVQAVLPENQLAKDAPYFDLRMTPGQEQEIELLLTNALDQEAKLEMDVIQATTTSVGSLDYSNKQKRKEKDSSIKVHIEDIINFEKNVSIPPKSKKIIKLKLSMPNEEFNGEILAGINIKEILDEKKDKKKSSGMSIKNEITQVIGLSITETDTKIEPNLDLKSAHAGQQTGKNAVFLNIQNSAAVVVNKLNYKADIYRKGGKKPLHSARTKDFRFAPNSTMSMPVSWEAEPFEAGTYIAKVHAECEETGQKWDWEIEFEITVDEARELNEKAIDIVPDNTLFYIIAAIVAVVVLIILIILVVMLRKRNQKILI